MKGKNIKLSKIRISDILFKANSRDLEKIVFKKKHKYKKAKCDVGLLLGGKSMIPYRVNECIDLFNQGIISKILISGGIGYTNIDRKHPEAYKLRDILYDGKRDIYTWNNSILTRPTIIKEAINLIILARKGLIEDKDIKGLSYIKKSSK